MAESFYKATVNSRETFAQAESATTNDPFYTERLGLAKPLTTDSPRENQKYSGTIPQIDGNGSFGINAAEISSPEAFKTTEALIAAPAGVLQPDRIIAGKTVVYDVERKSWFTVERKVISGRATYYAVGDSTGTGTLTSTGERFRDYGTTTFATWNAPGIPNKSKDSILLVVNQNADTANYRGREINAAIGRRNDSGPHPRTGAIIDLNQEARAQVFPRAGESQVVVFELKPVPANSVPAGADPRIGVYYQGFPATSGDPRSSTRRDNVS